MINHIQVPAEFVKLAEQWHSGLSDMLYAVASTGNLTTGTNRPWNDDESRPMTDEEWYASLYSALASDIRHCLKIAGKHNDSPRLRAFLEWTEATELALQSTLSDKVN
jgi:hypothetical protein